MKTRWNVQEILSKNTDTLGFIIGFTALGILITWTVIVITVIR